MSQLSQSERGEKASKVSCLPGNTTFRKAVPDDAEVIAEIALRVNVHSYAQFDRGFLFYSLSAEEYRTRITAGHSGYLFCLDGEPIGFLLGYSNTICEREIADSEADPSPMQKLVVKYANARQMSRFFVADQAAIVPEYQDRGYGSLFFNRVMESEPGPYFSDMLEAPLRNPRIKFWMKHGFKKIAEFKENPPERYLQSNSGESSFEQLTWGLYLLDGVWR